MLFFSVRVAHVVEECVMLVGGFGVTHFRLGIEEEHLTVLHSHNKINIKQRHVAIRHLVRDGLMLFALIAILVPPVDAVGMGFEEVAE